MDLRLFNRDIMRRALPVLMAILERETRGWFLHFRERLISELRSQKLPDEEIERVSVLYIFTNNLILISLTMKLPYNDEKSWVSVDILNLCKL